MLKEINKDRVFHMLVDEKQDDDFVLIGKETFPFGDFDLYRIVLLDKESKEFHYYTQMNRRDDFIWQSRAYPISAIAFTPLAIENNISGTMYHNEEYLAEYWTKTPPVVTKYI